MVYQSGKDDCGKAVVRNMAVLVFGEDDFQILPLREACRDFLSIRRALQNIGIQCIPYAIESLDFVRKEHLPGIAQIKNGNKAHFVVVRKIGRKVLVDDPEFGTYSIKRDEFQQVFMGKMLLMNTKGEKPDRPHLKLFSRGDNFLFTLCFLVQFFSLFLGIFFMGEEETLIFSILFLLLYAIGVGFLFLLSLRVRKRLTREVFLPFLRESRQRSDAPILGRVLDAEVRKAYSLVLYGVFLLNLLAMFASNGLFYSLLAVLGVLLSLSSVLLRRETNRTRRFCSLKETSYLSLLGTSNRNNDALFLESEKKASVFLGIRTATGLLKVALVALVILSYMLVYKMTGLDFFLFGLFLTLGVGQIAEKLSETYLDDSLEARDINALSRSLPLFLLKSRFLVGYTNRAKGGSFGDARNTNSGLSRQDEGKEGT